MKIDKVTLNNLTSFEGLQTIDFTTEPLRSAGLFAITGDTGAGKSTLLGPLRAGASFGRRGKDEQRSPCDGFYRQRHSD